MSSTIKGQFTIDRQRAREKLSRYQLSDPYAYVLEIVQSAILRGATELTFRFDADDMRVQFDGERYTEEELSNLELAVLEKATTREERARRQLAVALLSVQSLEPKLVVVDSWMGARLERRAGQAEKLGPSSRSKSGNSIHVRDRWHPKILLEFWRQLRGKGEEQVLLRERCAASRVPILVNRKLISQIDWGVTGDTRRAGEVEIKAEGLEGWGGFINGMPAELLVYCDGVRIEKIPLELGPMPFRAVVHGERLSKDLSGGAVLRDQAFQEMMEAVARARKIAIRAYCNEDPGFYFDQIRAELLTATSGKELEDVNSYPGCLCQLPIWDLATGGRVTFSTLLETRNTLGYLPFAVEWYHDEVLEDLPVVWRQDKDKRLDVRRLMGHSTKNVTRRFKAQVASKANRKRWLSRPTRPVLQGGKTLVKRTLSKPEVRGEVGVYRYPAPPVLRIIKQGCLLYETAPARWPKGLEVVLEADFTPLKTYEGAQIDGLFVRCLLQALTLLPEMYDEAAGVSKSRFRRTRDETLEVLGDFLRVASLEDPISTLLRDCGVDPGKFTELRGRHRWNGPDLEHSSPLLDVRWVDTEDGKKTSLRELRPDPQVEFRATPQLVLADNEQKTLSRILGDSVKLKQASTPDEKGSARPTLSFKADPRWLREEYFLVALRRELVRIHPDDEGLLQGLNLSRMMMSDAASKAAITLKKSGVVTVHRRHPLVTQALQAYQEQPLVLLLLASVLYSTLNRALPRLTDHQEEELQGRLLEYALEGSFQSRLESAQGEKAGGYLEPVDKDGVCRGWACDPGGLGLRFFRTEPTLQSEPMAVLFLEEPREEGGFSFEFPLPKPCLDGKKVELWVGVVEPETGALVELSGSPRTFAAAVSEPTMPIGYVDRISDSGLVEGWCVDPNEPEVALRVDFHLDGNWRDGEFIGQCTADKPRPDVNEGTGYPGDHGFAFQVPAEFVDGCRHTVSAYAIDSDRKLGNPLLKGCPMSFGGAS